VPPRIALATGRRARSHVESVVSELRRATGWVIDVVEAPIDVAALIPRDMLENLLRSIHGRYDIVIVPGTLDYSLEGLDDAAGAAVVRGPSDPDSLRLLSELGEEGLQRLAEQGRLDPSLLLDKWLEELREHHASIRCVDVCGVRVPIRPPPIAIVAELFIGHGTSAEAVAEQAAELLERGGDILVAGFGQGWDREEALRVLRVLVDRVGPVAVDTPDKMLALEAARRGLSCLTMSLSEGDPLFERLPRGSPVVVIPLDSSFNVPGGTAERTRLLEHLVRRAERAGLIPIADPMVDPPGWGLAQSVAAYVEASSRIPGTPLLAGIANIYELIDADTHGQIAVLTQLFAEAGVSLMLVTEKSRKAAMAVTEASIAATMTSVSLLKKRWPKDLGVDLLYAKEKRPRSGNPRLPRKPRLVLDASSLAEWYGFRQDRVGSHIIVVEDDVIRDVYIGRRGVVELRGRSAKDIYKAVSYLGLAREPSHYAYLGYELCRAELATVMKRSYVQDEPLLTPPWARCRRYSARSMSVAGHGNGDSKAEKKPRG